MRCLKCHIEKETSAFNQNLSLKRGFDYWCVECSNPGKKPQGKKCDRCQETLSLDSFAKKGDGLQPWCRSCTSQYNKERKKLKEKVN